MWETEHSQVTDVDADRLWSVFEGVHSGRIVLPGGDVFRPEGPLEVGTKIQVTPAGQDTMISKVVAQIRWDRRLVHRSVLTSQIKWTP